MYSLEQFTFLIAFLLLSFSSFITGIEGLKTENKKYRSVLTVETFVSLVAGYVYYKYLIDKPYQEATPARYVDWFITTPFLLLSLCLLLNKEDKFPLNTFILIVIFNWIMLAAGYMAEIGYITNQAGLIIGFGALAVMFWLIYDKFKPKNNKLFYFFVILWSLYGVAFTLEQNVKTVCYNMFDVIAKVGVGLWTWAIVVGIVDYSA